LLGIGGGLTGSPIRNVERIYELGDATFDLPMTQVIEAHPRRQTHKPTGRVLRRELVGPLDGARDGLLAEVIGFGAISGHAVTHGPEALSGALDGGEHPDHGWLAVGRRRLHRLQGRTREPLKGVRGIA
jgi:hypothetical protein